MCDRTWMVYFRRITSDLDALHPLRFGGAGAPKKGHIEGIIVPTGKAEGKIPGFSGAITERAV